jgi:uncharacterized protein YjbI with pentapeptide repeats
MFNEEHLTILRQGVEAWNKWREENPKVIPNLSQVNFDRRLFEDTILYRINVLGVNLPGINFANTDISRSNLTGANFNKANLSGANFSKANLAGTQLIDANLSGSQFTMANLVGSQLARANLQATDFCGANLSGAELIQATLTATNFTEANLSGAGLTGVQPFATNFERAILTGACIEDCYFPTGNNKANLNGVICKYVYQKNQKQERLPPDRDLEFGEFSKLFQSDRSYSRLSLLETLITRFERLLNEQPQGNESLFHNFLIENPILLDVYGEPDSKPKFPFPEGDSPLGKKYVEPDIIIKYPGNKYKLVELERPSKHWGIKQGQTTSELNQAAFQCSEWDYYIKNHYELIKDRYPGISNQRSYMVVIGRKNEANVGGRNPEEYRHYIANHYPYEICFYEDLLDKAKQVHAVLTRL